MGMFLDASPVMVMLEIKLPQDLITLCQLKREGRKNTLLEQFSLVYYFESKLNTLNKMQDTTTI